MKEKKFYYSVQKVIEMEITILKSLHDQQGGALLYMENSRKIETARWEIKITFFVRNKPFL